ncbi:MAG TPA: helix-turn-helix domain-containing protein [Candidatus Glassbacteria bacterium]|nr:helix-turn-helix domain-containing protein [Candidatus Glassbacteria bacterium]
MGKRKRYNFSEKGIYKFLDEKGIVCGVYTIYLSKGKLTYPKGKSDVLYIGKGGTPKNGVNGRLTNHLSGKPSEGASRIVYGYLKHGNKLNFDVKETSCGKTAGKEEKRQWNIFKEKFGLIPLGNNQAKKEVKSKEASKHRTWTPNREQTLIKLYRRGKTYAKISKVLKLTPGKVAGKIRHLQRNGVIKARSKAKSKTTTYKKGPKQISKRSIWTESLVKRLIKIYKEGRTVSEIRKKLHHSQGQVSGKIRELQQKGILKRRR